jgi:hypothetical protein
MKISINDFDFYFTGYGRYKVRYTSPSTKKQWVAITTDMELIDWTKNADEIKIKDLIRLKRFCKQYNY